MKRTCGIYRIRSKKFPYKCYVGASSNIISRKYHHLRNLENGIHHNLRLQSHVNEFGLDDLSFEIIEECSYDKLQYKEQYYISKLNSYFNEYKFAGMRDNGIDARAKDVAIQDIINDNDQDNRFHYRSCFAGWDSDVLPICSKGPFAEKLYSL